jgi:hypothetical protein
VCDVVYIEKIKQLVFDNEPCECFVTGVVRKATGVYQPGDTTGSSLVGYDYDPPYLAVDKYHVLYECKIAINKKPFLVHPDDIETLE